MADSTDLLFQDADQAAIEAFARRAIDRQWSDGELFRAVLDDWEELRIVYAAIAPDPDPGD